MLALSRHVFEPVWSMIEARLPERQPTCHPLGCHRRRVPDRICFNGIAARLVTGCSWDVAGRLAGSSESTLRRRFREWEKAGVFSGAVEEALDAYDTVIGFRLSNVAVDASQHKAPTGGECSGPNLWDRAKLGWKWSLLTDSNGVPLGWEIDAANKPDAKMLSATFDAVNKRVPLSELGVIHLDRGYSMKSVREECARRALDIELPERTRRSKTGQGKFSKTHRRTRVGPKKKMKPEPHRWQVERTNSWLSNFGQMRRNTDRRRCDREAQLDLAIAFILAVKLVKHVNRYKGITRPY